MDGEVLVLGYAGTDVVDVAGRRHLGLGGAGVYAALACRAAGSRAVLATDTSAPVRAWLRDAVEEVIGLTGPTDAHDAMTFGLAYDDQHRLARFWLRPDPPPTLLPALSQVLDDDPSWAWTHLCPLRAGDLAATVEAVHEHGPLSVQLHFGELAADRTDARTAVRAAQVLFLNEGELLLLTGTEASVDALAALRLLTDATAFVTSPEGVTVVERGDAQWHAAPPTAPRDVTGAGDVFAGTVVGSLVRGAPVDDAVRLGLAYAAVTVATRSSEGILVLAGGDAASATAPADVAAAALDA